jgi:hypothetical protein
MARTSRNWRLIKQHLILDFTNIIMLPEGKYPSDENANRVWVTIIGNRARGVKEDI